MQRFLLATAAALLGSLVHAQDFRSTPLEIAASGPTLLAEPLRLANGDIGLMELNPRNSDRRRLRFDDNGHWRGDLSFAGPGRRLALANGEFIAVVGGGNCDVLGLDRNLQMKWRHSQLFPYASEQGLAGDCGDFATDANGRIWYRSVGTKIGSLLSDGSIGPSLDVRGLRAAPAEMKATTMTVRPGRPGAVFAVMDTQSAGHTAIIAFDADMHQQWQFEPQLLVDESINIAVLNASANGDVTAIGLSRIGAADNYQLYLTRVSADGVLQLTRRYGETRIYRILKSQQFANGSTGVLFSNIDMTQGLISLATNGLIEHAHSAVLPMNLQIEPVFHELGNGTRWLIGNRKSSPDDPTDGIYNIGMGFAWALDSGEVRELGIGAHTGSIAYADDTPLVFGSSLHGEAMRFDGTGNGDRVTFNAPTALREDGYPEAFLRLPDGDQLVFWRRQQSPSDLARVGADGQTRWRRSLAGPFQEMQTTGAPPQIMQFAGQTACVVTYLPGVECLDIDSGATRFTHVARVYAYTAASDHIEMLVNEDDGHLHHQRLTLSNALAMDRDLGVSYPRLVAPGYALAAPADGSSVLIESQVDAIGPQFHALANDSPLLTGRIVRRMRDGELLVIEDASANEGPVIRVSRRPITGAPRWTRDLAGYRYADNGGIVRVDEQSLHVDAYDDMDGHHDLHTLDAVSGASIAAPIDVPPGGATFTYRIDAATRSIGIVSARDGAVTWRTVFADGREAVPRSWRCPGDCTVLNEAMPDSDGEVLVRVVGWHDDRSLHLLSLAQSPRLRQAPVPDDGSIAGVFTATNETNRGYVIDWLPSSRTLFVARFAGDTSTATVRQLLDWETLQGTVAAGTGTIVLNRYHSANGRFSSADDAPTTAFGTATFRFDGCDRAELVLSEGEGANITSRTVHLQRSGPRLKTCNLLDGSSIAAQAERPARGRFDARQSGAWVASGANDQGLLAAVLPANVDSNGVFFAPWFTYWPNAGDNTGTANRHWLTLQGTLTPASDGNITLIIYRATAGSYGPIRPSNTYRVGTATWTLTDCEHATLDYQFDPDESAQPYAGRSGVQNYARPGACSGGP